MLNKQEIFSAFCCGIAGIALCVCSLLFCKNPLVGAAGVMGCIFFIGLVACEIVVFFRDRAFYKRAELSDIVDRCHQHPDKDFQDVVREAVLGVRYWTFKKVWREIGGSYDYGYGRVFTGIFR